MKVGFVGVGKIGNAMCVRLIDAGHEVSAFDLAPPALARIAERGARAADSSAGVAAASEIVLTCLPSPAEVVAAVSGPDGILDGIAAGGAVVDLSTNAPDIVRGLASAAGERGVAFLDAPVAGGVPKAVEGTLTLMVGGGEDDFVRVKPILDCLGANVFHLGRPGAGSAAKLGNNLMAACNLAASFEIFMTMKRHGIEPDRFFEVVNVGSGASAALERYRKVLVGDFSAEFTVDMAYKDLSLALNLGEEAGVPLRFGYLLKTLSMEARARGYGQDDACALVRILEDTMSDELRATDVAAHS